MARLPVALLSALSISDTAAHASDWGAFDGSFSAIIQLTTTGTLAGAWKIETKAHPDATACDVTSALTPAIAAVTSGGSNQNAILDAPFNAARATFTASSGTGTASVYFCPAGFNP